MKPTNDETCSTTIWRSAHPAGLSPAAGVDRCDVAELFVVLLFGVDAGSIRSDPVVADTTSTETACRIRYCGILRLAGRPLCGFSA